MLLAYSHPSSDNTHYYLVKFVQIGTTLLYSYTLALQISIMPDESEETRADTVLSRKLRKVLDSKLEGDKDTMDALRELSTFFKENNLQTRRNLRGEIERRNLTITHDFLAAFRSVKETLDTVDQNVRGMSRSCASMQVGD